MLRALCVVCDLTHTMPRMCSWGRHLTYEGQKSHSSFDFRLHEALQGLRVNPLKFWTTSRESNKRCPSPSDISVPHREDGAGMWVNHLCSQNPDYKGVMLSWNSSNRLSELPPNWPALRKAVLKRDGNRCQLQYQDCTVRATEVDHRLPGDDHDLSNLQAVCTACHSIKSSQEGIRERIRRKRLTKRPREQHPGLRKAR